MVITDAFLETGGVQFLWNENDSGKKTLYLHSCCKEDRRGEGEGVLPIFTLKGLLRKTITSCGPSKQS